ncbi:hypothetical protein GV792_04550 [Nocardia cyriacigeorgica]|uniref:hypothetical protein n=1 Tax=Nocardia cyriacigeorgica TaxID=135487 RepID=UPI0013BB1051|nr:hypothetical protein [Nocardia cyriacigeorgica]NEW49313.1 hypothetical protein [Nocardia cyriacigeorgica]
MAADMPPPQSPVEFDRATIAALTEAGYSEAEATKILAVLRAAGVIRSTVETTLAGIQLVGTNARIRLDNGLEVFGRATRDGVPLVPDEIDWHPGR